MLSKEEIEKDIFYKNLYMQQPFTLLTDENLRDLELHCEKTMHYGSGRAKEEHSIVLELIRKYKELESDKQKLIEKLEEDIDELETLNDNYTDADIFEGIYTTRGQIIKTREILSILKGENQVTVK